MSAVTVEGNWFEKRENESSLRYWSFEMAPIMLSPVSDCNNWVVLWVSTWWPGCVCVCVCMCIRLHSFVRWFRVTRTMIGVSVNCSFIITRCLPPFFSMLKLFTRSLSFTWQVNWPTIGHPSTRQRWTSYLLSPSPSLSLFVKTFPFKPMITYWYTCSFVPTISKISTCN